VRLMGVKLAAFLRRDSADVVAINMGGLLLL
jgi:hypothetical protein